MKAKYPFTINQNYKGNVGASIATAEQLNNLANEIARYNNILIAKYSQNTKEEFYDMYLALQGEKI
jgi:hypothetical protein